MGIDFIHLTLSTPLHVIFYILLEFGPPIGSLNEVFHPCNSRMSSGRWVVEFLHDFPSLCHVSCDYEPSFLIPLSTEFLQSMCICPLTYHRHFLFVEWFFNGQVMDE